MKANITFGLLFGLLCLLISSGVHSAPNLAIGTATAWPDAMEQVPVTYTTDIPVIAMQFDVLYDATQLNSTGIAVGGGALQGNSVNSAIVSPGVFRVIITPSSNNTPLAQGTLATLPFTVKSNASKTTKSLAITNVIISDHIAMGMTAGILSNGTISWKSDYDNDGIPDDRDDSDGDGMMDSFELLYGLNPTSSADASENPDGDGLNNLEEYLAGTNPKVADALAQPTITPPGGSFSGSVQVTLTNKEARASIFYTLDGSEPSQSSLLYGGEITISKKTTVKAKAYYPNYKPSTTAVASFINAARVSTGLVALYNFDEGSGAVVRDTSGIGAALDLTIQTPANTRWLPGALSLDTATRIVSNGGAAKLSDAVVASGEMTVEAWVKPQSLSLNQSIVAFGSASSQSYNFYLTNGYRLRVRSNVTSSGDGTWVSGSGAASVLQHVVVTRSVVDSLVRIYVDGSEVKSQNVAGWLSGWSAYPLVLGNHQFSNAPWLGELHLVAFYGRALSPAEIQQNYSVGANSDSSPPSSNLAPVANNGNLTTSKGTAANGMMSASDGDGDTLRFSLLSQGSKGFITLTNTVTGAYTYTPNLNAVGSDQFTFQVNDGIANSNIATVTVTISDINTSPQAASDSLTTNAGSMVTVSVSTLLGNDTDADGDILSLGSVSASSVQGGVVTYNAGMQQVNYTPPSSFNGQDSFTYIVNDGRGASAIGTVIVTVNPVALPMAVTPVLNPTGGNFSSAVVVSLTSTTSGVSIYYTLDNSEPTSASVLYNGAFQLTQSATLKAKAFRSGYTPSATASGIFTISSGSAGDRVTTGLVALYNFDEGSGAVVRDTSGVGAALDLTIQTPANTHWLPGALSLDTATRVMSSDGATKLSDAIAASGEMTVEAWVKPQSLSLNQSIVAFGSASSQSYNFYLTNGYRLRVRTNSASSGDGVWVSGSGAASVLQHVVVTRSDVDSLVRIYVDGNEVKSQNVAGWLSGWAAYPLVLGNHQFSNAPWLGEMHLVAFYGRALSPVEVQQNYTVGP